jgi:hypothetical protein
MVGLTFLFLFHFYSFFFVFCIFFRENPDTHFKYIEAEAGKDEQIKET